MYGNSPSLDQFRAACLLAFYEFHQFLGQQAWIRIGTIIRIAYWIGLDRLESMHLKYPEWRALCDEELEQWRYVWWCLYLLDSYANLSMGTPYLIDERRVNTSLVGHSRSQPMGEGSIERGTQGLFLPSQPAELWELVARVLSGPAQTRLFNMHIVTTTALRDNPLVDRRLRGLTASSPHNVGIEGRLSRLRLALPPNFLNPRRNAFASEDGMGHHQRLVCVLHLHMARLLTALQMLAVTSGDHGGDTEQRLLGWQQVLEVCQDIAAISEQWDSSFSLTVDPAIAMVLFTALVFLDLQKKSTASPLSAGLAAGLQHSETVLLLQLEQFANLWTLPLLLILSFKGFQESVRGPLSTRQIQFIMSRFEAPLHPRWLHFLSSAPSALEAFG